MAEMGEVGARTLEDFEQDYVLSTAETEVLGRGGFSTVYTCTNRISGSKAAVKVAPYLVANDYHKTQKQKEQLITEARISTLCKSPQIVEFLGLYMGRAEIYIVFEYLSGGELFDAIVNKDHFSEIDASKCMRDILLAVQVCHRNNVIHRDLKPENLLLTEDGRIKLADFGLAIVATTTAAHGFCGTPSYMAPELVASRDRGDKPKSSYNQAVDVWACGVVLYILLVGYQPFWAEDREELYAQIEDGRCEYPDDFYSVSSAAKELVRAMLCVDVAERITADQALECDWIQNFETKANSNHCAKTITNMRGFNARRRFKAGVRAVVATARVLGLRGGGAGAAPVLKPAMGVGVDEVATDEVQTGVRAANKRLIDAIVNRDWDTYTTLVDPAMTCYEPEAPGVLVEGLDFHKFYFDLPQGDGPAVPPQTTLVGERVTPLGPGVALQTYSRVTQAVSATGVPFTMKSEETRVWRAAGGGRWVCVHFHRSGSPSAPNR